jgi:hypothetical protein
MAGRAARTFRNCRAVVLPRIGHVAMMERPDLVAAEMREFLHGVVRDQVAQPGPANAAAVRRAPGQPAALQPAAGQPAALQPAAGQPAARRRATRLGVTRLGATRQRGATRRGATRRGAERAGAPGWALGLRGALSRVSR